MKLASRLITLLIILTTFQVSAQDTIWFKSGEVVACKIRDIEAHKNSLSYTPEGDYLTQTNINLVEKANWNNVTFSGQKNWLNAEPSEFPYLSKLSNGTYGVTKSLEFQTDGDIEVLDFISANFRGWEGLSPYPISNFYKTEEEISFTLNRNTTTGSFKKSTSQVWLTLNVSFKVSKNRLDISCSVKYAQNKFSRKRSSDSVLNVFGDSYRKKNGEIRKFNYYAAERSNHIIGYTMSILEDQIKTLQTQNQNEEAKKTNVENYESDLREYLTTSRIHPLEGIWSVDVRMDKDRDFEFKSQAFQIGIKRLGDGFISVPLQPGTPQYERSVKVFQRTAEPNVFLMQGYFPDHDYISTATVYQKSDGVVDFIMQLPKAEVRRIAKAYSSTYDGDLKLTYRLIKVFPMPDTDVPEKDKEEQEHWTATGSGFAVSTNGLVATNYHVIEGGKTIHVRGVNGKSNQKLIAEVVAKDKEKDLAILKITDKNFTKINELPYSISVTDEKMGAEVFSLGFPKPGVFGDGLIFTDGKVSATKGLLGNEVNYQMTVPITFGNSGGPIFNKLGQVIGVSVAGTLDVELLTASYSVKSKYLIDLLKTVTDYAPVSKEPSATSLEDQIEAYKNFVYLIEVSSN